MEGIFIGLDLGTQGVRGIAVDEEGNLIRESSLLFSSKFKDPNNWWKGCETILGDILSKVERKPILSIGVTSTSGTVVCIDEAGKPLSEAFMYNDPEGSEESSIINEKLQALTLKLGYKFNASYALSKIMWIKRHLPELYNKTRCFLSPTDFINYKLTGVVGVTDHTNALKFGFDLIDYRWPKEFDLLEIDTNKLPKVVKPGEFIDNLNLDRFKPHHIPVITGLTDGNSGQIASGAVRIRDIATTLGTTLVIKGVTKELVKDSLGRFYSHLHPEGKGWFPGGSSNVGGEALEKIFPGKNYKELDAKIEHMIPTSLLVYPLVRKGERFPFVNPYAEGFVVGNHSSEEELYAGYLEGVAYTERLCYDMLSNVGVSIGDYIYTVGGGSKSLLWMKIRASIMNKTLKKPKMASSSMGMAILGASKVFYPSLEEAVSKMVKIDLEVDPETTLVSYYEGRYNQFVEALKSRGYI
ncbi:MAG: FGGY-family carbohydrate kinase [bacterium]